MNNSCTKMVQFQKTKNTTMRYYRFVAAAYNQQVK